MTITKVTRAPVLTIDEEAVSTVEAQMRYHEAEAAKHAAAATIAKEWLRTTSILRGQMKVTSAALVPNGSKVLSPASDDLTAAIEGIANGSPTPLAKKVLKEKLRGLGFGEDRLANYFYTAIMRLKKRERISVLPDGRVWKPAPKAAATNE